MHTISYRSSRLALGVLLTAGVTSAAAIGCTETTPAADGESIGMEGEGQEQAGQRYDGPAESDVYDQIQEFSAVPAAPAVPIDPRTVPALMAGAIYLPGVGETEPDAGYYHWASQATQENTCITLVNGAFNPPVPATAQNGERIWRLPGPNGAFIVPTAGTALRFATKGSYAGWFRAKTLNNAIQYFFQAWPNDGANNRFLLYKNQSIGGGSSLRAAVSGCPSGVGNDAAADPNDRRWEGNTQEIHDWTKWVFVRFTFDFSLDNYSDSGRNFSHKLKMFFNEVLDKGDGFGAPQQPQADPPGGPVFGGQLYTGAQNFVIAADYISSSWVGDIGPIYVANGQMTAATWAGVMRYHAPTN